MASELLIEESGAVASIAFHRPAARNALTLPMLEEMAAALQAFAGRTDLRVVVLRGAGELPFSAGYDMTQLPARTLTSEDARAIHAPVRAVANAIARCRHPVVGAAREFVFGAAFDIFLHCDLRICSDDTRFCMPPNRHGFLYPVEGVQRLAAVAGVARAGFMLLTGGTLTAAEAMADGIVQKEMAAARFEAELQALCATLAGNAPLSVSETKQILQALARGETVAGDAAMYERIAACLNSDDVREAKAAFREKRPPVFRGC
jgi:enoyl-CoA hydratase/carnithine racemase